MKIPGQLSVKLNTIALGPDVVRREGAPLILHYGNRDLASHAFHARLQTLATQLPRLTVIDHYSRGSHPNARPGRLTAEAIDASLIAERARFYFCGPDAMIADITTGLIKRGVPAFEIFSESFGGEAAEMLAPDPLARHEVRFARSGKVLTWTPDTGTLLDLAEANGLALPSGCRVGQCESCSINIIEGGVVYTGSVGNDEPGACLTCRAVPVGPLVLDA